MIGMLHYAIPASIFAIVLFVARYLWRSDDDGWSWLKQLVPAAIAALLGWLALRLVENLLAVHFLAGGPEENAVAEGARWTSLVYFVAMVVGMISQSIWHALQIRKANKPPFFDKWEFVKTGSRRADRIHRSLSKHFRGPGLGGDAPILLPERLLLADRS